MQYLVAKADIYTKLITKPAPVLLNRSGVLLYCPYCSYDQLQKRTFCKYVFQSEYSFIGIPVNLAVFSLKSLKISWDIFGVIMGQFIISPIITIVIGHLLHAQEIVLNVFILQFFLPTMTSTPLFGKYHHCAPEYAAIGTAMTAFLSLIIIPLYLHILI